MAETAANLIDEVLPVAPYRQYVLTLPFPLRYWAVTSRRLLRKIYKIFSRMVEEYLCQRAITELGIKQPATGSVTFVQYFGSALQLTPHFHLIAFDGVFETNGCGENDTTPRFHALRRPSDEEIAELLAKIVKKCVSYLRRQGYLNQEGEDITTADTLLDTMDEKLRDEPSLLQCIKASILGRVAFGENVGNKLTKIGSGFGYEQEIALAKGRCCVSANGFTLHANVAIKAHHREALEKLIRYTARPPLSNERLSTSEDGQILLQLKRMFSDGTTAIKMSPTTLIARLCAIIPLPYTHLVRYHGVLAPHHKLRAKIVLKPRAKKSAPAKSPLKLVKDCNWGRLLARCFGVDVSTCLRCQGEMRIVAAVLNRHEIQRYLERTSGSTLIPASNAGSLSPG